MSNHKKPFYVGYLPVPAEISSFYLVFVPVLLVIGLVAGYAFSGSQQYAGTGTWQPTSARKVAGVLSVAPYPILHTADGRDILLVRQGKRSADAIALPHAGQSVSVTGFPVERGGWHMLEVIGEDAFEAAANPASVQLPASLLLGAQTLQGEVVDSKCFLGVMKPGAGKVHRACASLCLLGGIPPMLVVRREDKSSDGYLLIGADGESLARQFSNDVAIPLSLSGVVEQRGRLKYLRVASGAAIRRLTGDALTAYGDTLAVSANAAPFCGTTTQAGPVTHFNYKARS